MADSTTTTTPTVLDLRPQAGSILYEFLRLGLVFDHATGDSAQTWADYAHGLRADITGLDATDVTFTDTTTRLPKTIPVTDLPSITDVVTWKSDNPLTPTAPTDTTTPPADTTPATATPAK